MVLIGNNLFDYRLLPPVELRNFQHPPHLLRIPSLSRFLHHPDTHRKLQRGEGGGGGRDKEVVP